MTAPVARRGVLGEEEEEEEDDDELRKKREHDVMSRLRRVKSLFNTKANKKKAGGSVSRPGTSHSTAGQ